MAKLGNLIRKQLNLPIIIVGLAGVIGIYHIFSYLIPFTDNAFVVTNVTPVAADVSGFITDIYVKNGQAIKKDQPIFKVYQEPYRLALAQASADYQQGLKKVIVLQRQIDKANSLVKSTQAELAKATYELDLKKDQVVAEAVPVLEIKKLGYDVEALTNKLAALQHEVAILAAQVDEQHQIVASLKAKMDNAQVNLDLTVVRAPSNGVVDNMYISTNTPIKIHEPVFSFIDTTNYYIQANLNETDLRNVRVGDKVTIMLRMYYFDKIFHGVIVNTLWAADRQTTSAKTQLQKVQNENEWLLLPQRFPVQIKVLDVDPNYPLNPGASAYVYISTKK
ncbi:MAG: HlyD family secretion protein [Burkholderiales bacterium]|jgi:multidrug resistance efflux pump|nr:HlyD family secretion protein [Burkholderiales bacterium]MBP9769148.1 HlyD family secretion protein [Burkholderiales bacterium]